MVSLGIDELLAREQIRDALYRYCRGVDRGDAALIRSVYHDDARDAHGAWEGPGAEFADFIVAAMDATPIPGQHHLTNILIEVRGEEAAVESYFLALHPYRPEAAAEPVLAAVGGRYLDRFTRRDGIWRIAGRRVVLDWSQARLWGESWDAQTQFPLGGRRDQDPSVSLFP